MFIIYSNIKITQIYLIIILFGASLDTKQLRWIKKKYTRYFCKAG